MYLNSVMCLVGRIMYQPKTICNGLLCLVIQYMDHIAKADAYRIIIHGSEASTYLSCIFYIHKLLFNTLWVLPLIDSAYIFPGGLVLFLQHILIISIYFKLVTKKFSSLVVHDIYWSGIPGQPRSLYQVCGWHSFLVAVLRNFKPPSYRVYICNNFNIEVAFRF